ncbi:MAG: hypothetical protein K2K68_07645, partial [Duncaniella sp.]|nr:hypothetical protein [Duncaniella sp.]
WFTHQGYGCLWELCCLLPACPLDTPSYHVSIRQATISLLLLLSRESPLETCKSLWGSSATTPRVDFHHRCMTCPSYKEIARCSTAAGDDIVGTSLCDVSVAQMIRERLS